ncbi:RsiV family protein [[Clostridium] symbiosum]|uniref:RsiV family protein n=1 Tax=Clostridium symbiosum TaxID=1512 RepID=UPI001D06999C|nr:RsiV family protein [[Clostridium] symbiosum]MCB6608646.1 RsiV family protein [[Clostridium] symbiosum]MCB6931662.1 RsiV family protein [[Clostridium] symbiosum]
MRRIKIKRKIKNYTAAAAVTALAALMPIAVTGCKRQVEVDMTAATAETETVPGTGAVQDVDIRKDTLTATGSTETMVESGRHLFFKYDGSIWSLDKATDKLTQVKTFEEGETNESFWVYRGNLYYDVSSADEEGGAFVYGLYKKDLETGEETHLMDPVNQASGIYASEDVLYIRGYNMNQAFALKEDGSLGEELDSNQTVYGRIPEGCHELYSGMLPFMVEHYGYMPVQNDSCLVIAGADGSGAKEVPEVTNTSSVLFDKDGFFVLFQDGSGNTQCYRYDAKTLEKTLLFASSDNPQLIQYRDGYLYYLTSKVYQTVSEGTRFYKVNAETGEVTKAASINTEPGTLNMYDYDGNFFVSEDSIYCQELKDYGVYIGKTDLGTGEEKKLLEPALYQSSIRELGHVEAEKKEIPFSGSGTTAMEIYIETMVFDGDSDAVKAMNRTMEERRAALLSYSDEMASYMDESLSYRDDFHLSTLIYEIAAINYLDDNLVCVEADGYEYSGGAHDMPFKDYFVFNRKTGERMKLNDLVDNSVEELQSIVGRAFRELAEKTNFAFESPEDLEHTIADDVSFDSAFYITPEGVVFYYAPYEIASYAEGFPEVTIPYSELKMKK